MREIFDRYLAALSRTERMPLRDLALYQQELLARLVRHARGLDFYRDRLNCLFSNDDALDLSRWNEVPILTRADVKAHGAAMRASKLAPELGGVSDAETSGSTGMPLRIAVNGLVFIAANALFTRMARSFGLDTARPLATIRLFGHSPSAPPADGRLSQGWSFVDPQAPLYELELNSPVDRQIEWLARHKPPYLLTQPSGALAIAEAVTAAEGRALGIEMVFLVAETIPESARELIAERLSARTAGLYSCMEVGTLACECNAAPQYHVAAENALVEIVDEHDHDVAPGGRGRVLVTGLYNYAMPFIRYDLGDIVEAGGWPCPCGRAAPVLARIDGRTRNAFIFRDGTKLYPRSAMVRPMHEFVPLRRYQIIQRDHENIEFRYIPDGSGRAPDPAALRACARRILHPSVTMRLVAVDALEVGPGGKVEEFISHVARPPG